MESILSKISEIIDRYESGEYITLDNLRVMLRELSSNYYYLTKYNIEYFEQHNAVQYKNKKSVAYGIILANEQVPEIRITRKILLATDRVLNSMRSEIAILRSEN